MKSVCTVHQQFEVALRRFTPNQLAFAAEETPVSWGSFAGLVERLAAGLASSGVREGDIVGYSLPNCPEAVGLPIALSQLGACAVPLFPMMPGAVRAGIFASLGCSLVVDSSGSVEKLTAAAVAMRASYRVASLQSLQADLGSPSPAPVEARSNRSMLISATSGTTGAPKSVPITEENATSALRAAADMAHIGGWRDAPNFSSMIAFPLSTSSILVPLGMLFAGTRLVFSSNLSPLRFLELAAHWNVDSLSAPPAYFETILSLPAQHQPALPNLRAVLTGMDFLQPTLLNRLCKRFSGLDRAVSGYGLVETSTVFMTWKAHEPSQLFGPTNVFEICPGSDNEIDVRDESGQSLPAGTHGELWVRGASVVSGYLSTSRDDADPFVNGWFRTGDLVRRIDATRIELCGRLKYLIKRGGKSIAPSEVQNRIESCTGVAASAVVGVKHPLYGEMIWAFVVANENHAVTLKDIMKICRSTLPNYMVPDHVTFLEQLPRGTGVGKLDREALIRMATEELSRIPGGTDGTDA